jgi:hypothetical protein
VAPERRIAVGGMDPTTHRLDDELQRKARGAMSSSSPTKASGVPTREYATNLAHDRRVKRSGVLSKPVAAKSSTDSRGPHGANRKETLSSIGPHP